MEVDGHPVLQDRLLIDCGAPHPRSILVLVRRHAAAPPTRVAWRSSTHNQAICTSAALEGTRAHLPRVGRLHLLGARCSRVLDHRLASRSDLYRFSGLVAHRRRCRVRIAADAHGSRVWRGASREGDLSAVPRKRNVYPSVTASPWSRSPGPLNEVGEGNQGLGRESRARALREPDPLAARRMASQ